MLKVIAEDFIKPEAIETVLPLYRELVEATKKEPLCIAYDLYVDEKDVGHFIFIEEWPDRSRWMSIAPAHTSNAWCR